MFEKPYRKVTKVFIHCTASDKPMRGEALKSELHKWHVKENGWSDIGYHYAIDKLGAIIPCRPLSKAPAAQYPHNTGTIAICVHGLEKFSSRSLFSLRKLCAKINEDYDGMISFHGHREVNEHKTCPVFDYTSVLKLDRFGRMP